VWLPLTSNGPPVGPVTIPLELELSPQSIVAVKSLTVPNGLASVRVATFPLNGFRTTDGAAQVAAIGASATFAVDVAVAELLALSTSVIFTLTV
jgi:hypothetical protein